MITVPILRKLFKCSLRSSPQSVSAWIAHENLQDGTVWGRQISPKPMQSWSMLIFGLQSSIERRMSAVSVVPYGLRNNFLSNTCLELEQITTNLKRAWAWRPGLRLDSISMGPSPWSLILPWFMIRPGKIQGPGVYKHASHVRVSSAGLILPTPPKHIHNF